MWSLNIGNQLRENVIVRKESKIWGTTVEICKNPFVEVHRAEVKMGGNCSIHIHKYKVNAFFLEKGELMIKQYRDNGLIDETILLPGDYIECRPGERHQFRALLDSVVYEIYFPMPIGEVDIVRETVGFIESPL